MLLDEIPIGYLQWALNTCNSLTNEQKIAIREILSGSTATKTSESSDVTEIIDSWYRRLAMEFHPDHGGSCAAMKAINRAHDLLREMNEALL